MAASGLMEADSPKSLGTQVNIELRLNALDQPLLPRVRVIVLVGRKAGLAGSQTVAVAVAVGGGGGVAGGWKLLRPHAGILFCEACCGLLAP